MPPEPRPTRATIDDVAREAGVSTATVSRALRQHHHVAESTRQRVAEAAERLSYVANPNASRLASGSSRTIGLLSPQLTSWYTSEVVAGVEEVLEHAEYDLLIGSANPLVRDRIFRGDATFRQRVDGVLLVDVFCSERGARKLSELDVPTIVLGERLRAVTSLSVDNRYGAALAARHLLELGHRRVAVIGGRANPDVDHNVPEERAAGFTAALAAAGVRLPASMIADGDFKVAGGYRAARALLGLSRPPTAVFCMSDEMAFGVLQAAREQGLTAGRDLSVVGFDDHPVAEAFGLTTVRQPVREMGRLAARLMLHHVGAPTGAAHHPVDVSLVARGSTGPVPA